MKDNNMKDMNMRDEDKKVDAVLAGVDRKVIDEFLRCECRRDAGFKGRFLALGVGKAIVPSPEDYSSRVYELIDDYSSRYGYINYHNSFDFNLEMMDVLSEVEYAIGKEQWDVAVAALIGISSCFDDIENAGDDSGGELSSIVDEGFELLKRVSSQPQLPHDLAARVYDLAMSHFEGRSFYGYDMRLEWMDIAIALADDAGRQQKVLAVLRSMEGVVPDYYADRIRVYIMRAMEKSAAPEEVLRYMYDNVAIPGIRARLIEKLYDAKDYAEALRLANEGEAREANSMNGGIEWRRWILKVYRAMGDKENALRIAWRMFSDGFGSRFDEELSDEMLYELMKSLVGESQWRGYIESQLDRDSDRMNGSARLFVYTQEKMWDRYFDYLRKCPSTLGLDEAPDEVKDLFKPEFIELYAKCVRDYFALAKGRDSYLFGAEMLKRLIGYGGEQQARAVIAEQVARRPRRPALIEELSKL